MAGRTLGSFAPLAAESNTLVEALQQGVVSVDAGQGHGSGVIWHRSDNGTLIVTNDHVALRDRLGVELADGRRFEAVVVARDRHNDLAALRVRAHDLPAALVGDSAGLRVGELIVAVGNPWGVRGTATLGIVSAIGGQTWMGPFGRRRELLQADVVLAPGNSGGPLADTSGRVVGIASMILSPGIALAIPSHVVERFVASLSGIRGNTWSSARARPPQAV